VREDSESTWFAVEAVGRWVRGERGTGNTNDSEVASWLGSGTSERMLGERTTGHDGGFDAPA
jgi:hypothetical protein